MDELRFYSTACCYIIDGMYKSDKSLAERFLFVTIGTLLLKTIYVMGGSKLFSRDVIDAIVIHNTAMYQIVWQMQQNPDFRNDDFLLLFVGSDLSEGMHRTLRQCTGSYRTMTHKCVTERIPYV